MAQQASFRFYSHLNDFLRKNQQNNWLPYLFKGSPAVKDAIEAIGVPHPEVALILVNGVPANFTYMLQAQDQVEVYPAILTNVIPAGYVLRPDLPSLPCFVLDVHLGKLAKALRLLGFDTLYQNTYTDEEIAELAAAQNRVVLTRDVGLLKQKIIKWGYWLRSPHPPQQLKEILIYFKLAEACQPLTRCLACNGLITEVPKETVLDELPPKTRLYFNQFYRCPNCRRVYWKGSHYDHMLTTVAAILPVPNAR